MWLISPGRNKVPLGSNPGLKEGKRMRCFLTCVVAACVAACVAPPEESSSESAVEGGGTVGRGEVIVIEGTWDACQDGGDCDPWYPDQDPPGVPDPTDPDPDGFGGGPGGGGITPPPHPVRRDCAKEKEDFGPQVCRDCCAWNHDNVDTPECNEIWLPPLREACRQAAIAREGACAAMCREPDEGILTSGGASQAP